MSATELVGRGCLTPRAISERFGISRSMIFSLIASGALPRIKLSARRIVIPVAAVEAYLAGQMSTTAAPSPAPGVAG